MSSAYPPAGGQLMRRCFRCGTPLPPNGTICGTCGAYNALPQGGWGQAQAAQSAQGQSWAPPQAQASSGLLSGYANKAGMPTAPAQSQFPAWGAPPAGPGTYAQPAQMQAFPPAQTPAMGGTPGPGQAQNAYAPANNTGYGNGYYRGPGTHGSANGAVPVFPGNGASYGYQQEAQGQKRRPSRGLVVLVGVLLLLVIAGGLTGLFYYGSRGQSAPMATPTVAFVTPSAKPLFRDTFTNNNTGWLVTSNPGKFSAQVGGGLMTLEDDDNKLLWDILPGKSFSDFRLDVDARLTKGTQDNAYGVYIRGSSTANSDIGTYYRLEIYQDDTFAVYKGVLDGSGNTQNTLVKYAANAAIQTEGRVNHITIIAQAGTMVFMVNGVTLYTYNDTSYRGGLVALFVSNLPKSPPGARATFANLAIFPAG